MYLNYLRTKQKELFLDLSIITSKVDNNFNDEEKNLIEQLCQEMNIEIRYETDNLLEDIVASLEEISSTKEKKIILLELLGLVLVDNKEDVSEVQLIKVVKEKFAITNDEVEKATLLVKQLYHVYSDFSSFINEQV